MYKYVNKTIIYIIYTVIALSIPIKSHLLTDEKLKLRIHNEEFFPIKIDKFLAEAEEIFSYECEKLQYDDDLLVDLYLSMNDSTKYRGTAQVDANRINIFVDKSFTESKFLGVFAHELGHILIEKWTKGSSPDWILNDGLASWLGGEYYLRWQDELSFNSFVKSILFGGFIEFSLEIFPYQLEPRKRDTLYMESASFVEYLINKYGLSKIRSQCAHVNKEILRLDTAFKAKKRVWENKFPKTIKDYQLLDKSAIKELNKISYEINTENENYRRKTLEIITESYIKIYRTEFSELKRQWMDEIAK